MLPPSQFAVSDAENVPAVLPGLVAAKAGEAAGGGGGAVGATGGGVAGVTGGFSPGAASRSRVIGGVP